MSLSSWVNGSEPATTQRKGIDTNHAVVDFALPLRISHDANLIRARLGAVLPALVSGLNSSSTFKPLMVSLYKSI
jgi:hypothetical protein